MGEDLKRKQVEEKKLPREISEEVLAAGGPWGWGSSIEKPMTKDRHEEKEVVVIGGVRGGDI